MHRHADADSDAIQSMTPDQLDTALRAISALPGGKQMIKAYLEKSDSESDAEGKAYSDPDYGRSWHQKSGLETGPKRVGNPSLARALNERFTIGAGIDAPVIDEMLRIYRKEKPGFRTKEQL